MTETLKDLALAAYNATLQAQAEQAEAARRQQIEGQARTLGSLIQQALGVDVAPIGPSIEIDDLTFTIITDDSGHWEETLRVISVCPTCGRRTYNPLADLVDLGAILANPPRCTFCVESDAAESTAI
jgi:hypothetical protein